MRLTPLLAAGAMILGMSGVHAQVPDGVRALQLQRDQQQSESVLRSQQFQREALQPPSPATAVQERALLDQAQRQQQQQLFQQQQVQGTMGETTVAPSAAARERQQQQQFDRERQQQLNRFEAERALQDAARR